MVVYCTDVCCVSVEWNSINLCDPVQGVVTRVIHTTLPGGDEGGGLWGSRGIGS